MTDDERRQQSYLLWRRSIPFTDLAIERAFLTLAGGDIAPYLAAKYRHRAAAVRRGHLSRLDIRVVLPVLIATCAFCGGPALYRIGFQGRCRTHRLMPAPGFVRHRERLDQRASAEHADLLAAFDAIDAHRKHAKARGRHHRSKP